MRELAADERAGDMKGWLQRLHAWLFEGDIFASVASNSILLRIHSTAEEFEGAAEDCFVPLQVVAHAFVCLAHEKHRKEKLRLLVGSKGSSWLSQASLCLVLNTYVCRPLQQPS